MKKPYEYYHKTNWRLRNLAFCKEYFIRDGYFPYSYFELLGFSGHRSYETMSKYLRDPKQFIGVDNDIRTMAVCLGDGLGIPEFNPIPEVPFRHILASGYDIALKMCNESKPNTPIGVFNFDDTRAIGLESSWKDKIGTLMKVAAKTVRTLGSCGVILNGSMTIRDPIGHLKEHVTMLRLEAKKLGLALPESEVLGNLDLRKEVVAKQDFTGPVGALDINKSDGQVYRMVTLRLFFKGNRITSYRAPENLF
jgi:hypothetical protein